MSNHRIGFSLMLVFFFPLLVTTTALGENDTQAWLDDNVLYVEYGGQKQMVDMEVYEAVISPDSELLLYTKRTGGGVGDVGRTLFLYNPTLRLREPLFQFTDLIKTPTWIKRADIDFILYTRARSGSIADDTVVLFDLGTRHTLLTFPGTIKGVLKGGGISYTSYDESGQPSGQYEFYVDEFLDHGTLPDDVFITASSHLEATVANYRPAMAFDGNWRTAWIEGVEGAGKGEWIQVEFQEPVSISKIYILTGFHKTHADFGDLFKLNTRLAKATIEFDGGQRVSVNFTDTKAPQLIDLGGSITTSTFRLAIKDAYSGSEWDDLCVSEIMFELG